MLEENYWTKSLHRRIARRDLLRGGALSGLGLSFLYGAGCSETQQPKIPSESTAVPDEPKYGGTLHIIGQDPLDFDPHATFSYRTHQTLSIIHDKVLQFPAGPQYEPTDFTPEPSLAEKWEQPDDVTFVFYLRPGIKWHNKPPVYGRPLEAADIKYTFERMLAGSFPYREMFEKVFRIVVLAKDKVKFTLSEPYAPFLSNLADNYSWIIAHEVAEKGADFKKAESAVGTGPFILERYEPDVMCTFKRNPDYWLKGMPYVDELQWIVMADPSTQLASLRIGKLDTADVDTLQVESVKTSSPELNWEHWLTLGGNCLFMRNDKPPFNDVRVRRATSLAIDRKAWLDSFFLGKGTIDNGPPLPAGQTYYKLPTDQLGPAAEWRKYDPDQAKKLLAEAGYPNGFKAKMDATAGYGPAVVHQAQAIKDFLAKIGIELTVNMKEYADFVASAVNGNYDDTAYFASTGYPEVDQSLYGMYHSASAVTTNQGHVSDRKLDLLLEKQRKQYNRAERRETVWEVSKHIADQCYYLFPPTGFVDSAWQPWLKNYRPRTGYETGNTYKHVWIDKSK